MVNSKRNQSKKFNLGEGTFELYFQMMIFSDLQSDFSHKFLILANILLGNQDWLALIIIREFNDDSHNIRTNPQIMKIFLFIVKNIFLYMILILMRHKNWEFSRNFLLFFKIVEMEKLGDTGCSKKLLEWMLQKNLNFPTSQLLITIGIKFNPTFLF